MDQSDDDKSKKLDEPQQHQLSPNALRVATADCLNSWINYLQMLNSMCSAGLRLAQSLSNLSQMHNVQLAYQCQNSWEELCKSTVIASNSVKTHIGNAMQDMSIGETFTDDDFLRQQEHNQQIITENLMAFINLQYQFFIAGCENFGSMAMCPLCQTAPDGIHNPDCGLVALQQCFSRMYVPELSTSSQRSSPHFGVDPQASATFVENQKCQMTGDASRQKSPLAETTTREQSPHPVPENATRGQSPIHAFGENVKGFAGPLETLRGPFPMPGQLHTMKSPFSGRGSRSTLHFPLFPLNCQRRWSEAGVEAFGDHSDETRRRWSMPWDSAWTENAAHAHRYLPTKLAIPSSYSHEKSRSTTPETVPCMSQPVASGSGSGSGSASATNQGVIFGMEGLAEAIHLLSSRPARCSIPQTSGHNYVSQWGESHEERMHRRMMYPGPPSQRGNWQSIDVPNSTGVSVNEQCDAFPLTSRKSSSSTDSSSCLSIHSRSTTSSSERGSANETSGPESIRLHTNFYSIWSGGEHLPFIRLPESQEPQDDSDTDDPPTEKTTSGYFPKPT